LNALRKLNAEQAKHIQQLEADFQVSRFFVLLEMTTFKFKMNHD